MKRFKNSPNFQVLKYSQFFLLNIEKRLRFCATLSLFMLLLRTKQFLDSRFSFLACLRWGEGSPRIGVMYRGRGFTMERASFTHKTSGGNSIFPRLSVRLFFFFFSQTNFSLPLKLESTKTKNTYSTRSDTWISKTMNKKEYYPRMKMKRN